MTIFEKKLQYFAYCMCQSEWIAASFLEDYEGKSVVSDMQKNILIETFLTLVRLFLNFDQVRAYETFFLWEIIAADA